MKTTLFLSIIVVLVLSCYAFGQIVVTHDTENQLSSLGSIDQELKANLMDYFMVYKCEFADSLSRQNTIETLDNIISNSKPEYSESKWDLLKPFSIEMHRNLVFLFVPNPRFIHSTFKFVYNIKQNKYFDLRYMTIDTLNALLSTEHAYLEDDGGVLTYCELLTILMHPNQRVKFIADIKRLLLGAVAMRIFAHYDLNKAKEYYQIKVDMPTIIRNDSLLNVTYFAAKGDDIVKIYVDLQGEKINNYREDIIGQVPYWYGNEGLY